jgi:hypothetical protein
LWLPLCASRILVKKTKTGNEALRRAFTGYFTVSPFDGHGYRSLLTGRKTIQMSRPSDPVLPPPRLVKENRNSRGISTAISTSMR